MKAQLEVLDLLFPKTRAEILLLLFSGKKTAVLRSRVDDFDRTRSAHDPGRAGHYGRDWPRHKLV